MATQSEIVVLGATRIPIPLSAMVAIRVGPNDFGHLFKIAAGAGSLEIVPIPLALSGSSAAGWGNGYVLGASESVQVDGPATFYLAATSATMTVAMVLGKTAGASFL